MSNCHLTRSMKGNLCYTRCLPITCVSIFSPNANILRIAFGDEAGKVTILKLADGQLTLDKEWPLLPGAVREIVWKSDGKNMIVLGEKACAINPDNGSTTGDVLGATGKILWKYTGHGVHFWIKFLRLWTTRQAHR